MISVIIPVYNVEPYLRKCLDSVIGQTYRDLEILIVDDGSTDGSGTICDEYRNDERVTVFHTENRGLSATRNLGLDNATGDWIGFVDSDDWIEPDMYEVLIDRAEETGADVVECGFSKDYLNKSSENNRTDTVLSREDAIKYLLHGVLSDVVWNKLWKSYCFEHIRFPEGRIFEEYATTYKVYMLADIVSTVSKSMYHYVQRKRSLFKTRDLKNLTDYWIAHRDRREQLWDRVDDEDKDVLLRFCARASARTWAYYDDCEPEDRRNGTELIREMHMFTKQQIPLFGRASWKWHIRIAVFFPHYLNNISLRTAWLMNRLYLRVKDKGTALIDE